MPPKETRVVVPHRATVTESAEVLKCVQAMDKAPPGQIVIDASNCERFDPMGISLLAVAAVKRVDQGEPPPLLVTSDFEHAQKYLREVEFQQFLERTPPEHSASQSGTPAMRRLTSSGTAYSYPAEVAQLVADRVPGISEDAAHVIRFCLQELLQNVFEHAHSPVGCVALARWYLQQRNVHFAIVDAGIGIPAALRREQVQGMQRLSDGEVIEAAVTRTHLTSRKGGQLGGLGLKYIREYVVGRKGKLTVISHGAKVVFTATGSKRHKSPYYFPGTAVEIDVQPAATMASEENGFF